VIYEWDPKKAKANLRNHGVSFEIGARKATRRERKQYEEGIGEEK